MSWRPARAVGLRPENARTRSLTFSVPGWAGHRPGQHVDLRLTAEDGYQAVRSYSIAAPPDGERVTVTVERVEGGEVSPYLVDEMRGGDRLEVRGPIGGYFVWEAEMGGPLLLVAGGSGIVPLMSMLRHRAEAGRGVPARLLYSVRSVEELIYGGELEELATDGLEVILTYTRTPPPGWNGHRRRVDAAMLAEVTPPAPDRPLAYICGPTPFVEAVAAGLSGLGLEPSRVRTERFGPSGGNP